MSELSSIELLLQNIDSLEGHHLHVVLEQQLGQYCHLENFKFKDVNGITRTMRTKRQAVALALLNVFLASSTPLLHLLTPSAESLLDPNIDNKEKQLKVFNSIHKAMNVSSQLYKTK